MARVNLDQGLASGIMLRGRELLIEARARRRVEPPGVAVRNHQRIEAPLLELLEQRVRVSRRLHTVCGQRSRIDARLTAWHGGGFFIVVAEVPVVLAVLPVLQREQQPDRGADRGVCREA